MIDYILDNMAVNLREVYITSRKLRERNILEYTICEEIAHEQRLAPEEYREMIKNESKTLHAVSDFKLLANLANEMIDDAVLDLDEGGGDAMVVYEAVAEHPPNLFITERIVVSDDKGVQDACIRHKQKYINCDDYRGIVEAA